MGRALRDLEGELRTIEAPDGTTVRALWFWIAEEPYVVPYEDAERTIRDATGKALLLIWRRVSGSTLDDLTLAPSYRVDCGNGRVLHGHVVAGAWEPSVDCTIV